MDNCGSFNTYFNRGNKAAKLAWDLAWSAAPAEFDLGLQAGLYGGGSQLHPDPHLACLRLGKRHYGLEGVGKRGKGFYGVPLCQVEGCEAVLVSAKEYHKRHKVCEVHAKAPKVVVLGLDQRFCQQCSRFHVVSEFDECKRSCRRRLAGHNQRRRKTSSSHSINSSQDENKLMGERHAHSLLSPAGIDGWISPADLSSRSSAALRELIAENRASVLARRILLDQQPHHQRALQIEPRSSSLHHDHYCHWDNRFHQASAHVTLDLMHVASPSTFGEAKGQGQQQQLQMWNSLQANNNFNHLF